MKLDELKNKKTLLIIVSVIAAIIFVASIVAGFSNSSESKGTPNLKANQQKKTADINGKNPQPAALVPKPETLKKGAGNFETDAENSSETNEIEKSKKIELESEKLDQVKPAPEPDIQKAEIKVSGNNEVSPSEISVDDQIHEDHPITDTPVDATNNENTNVLNNKKNKSNNEKIPKFDEIIPPAPQKEPEGNAVDPEKKVESPVELIPDVKLNFVGGYVLKDSAYFAVYKYEDPNGNTDNYFIEITKRPAESMILLDEEKDIRLFLDDKTPEKSFKDLRVIFVKSPDTVSVSKFVKKFKSNSFNITVGERKSRILIEDNGYVNAGGLAQYKIEDLNTKILEIFASENVKQALLSFKNFLLEGYVYNPINLKPKNLSVNILISYGKQNHGSNKHEISGILKKKEVNTSNAILDIRNESDDDDYKFEDTVTGEPEVIETPDNDKPIETELNSKVSPVIIVAGSAETSTVSPSIPASAIEVHENTILETPTDENGIPIPGTQIITPDLAYSAANAEDSVDTIKVPEDDNNESTDDEMGERTETTIGAPKKPDDLDVVFEIINMEESDDSTEIPKDINTVIVEDITQKDKIPDAMNSSGESIIKGADERTDDSEKVPEINLEEVKDKTVELEKVIPDASEFTIQPNPNIIVDEDDSNAIKTNLVDEKQQIIPDLVPIVAKRYESDYDTDAFKYKALHKGKVEDRELFVFSIGIHDRNSYEGDYRYFESDDSNIHPKDEPQIRPKKDDLLGILNKPLNRTEFIDDDYEYEVYFGGKGINSGYTYNGVAQKLVEIVESSENGEEMFENFVVYTKSGYFIAPFDLSVPNAQIIVQRREKK